MNRKIQKIVKQILPIFILLTICYIFVALYKNYNIKNIKLIISVDGHNYTYENNIQPSLNDNKMFTIKTKYGYNKIEIKDGSIHVIDSDCKDKICIHTGEIGYGRMDDMIICAPHRICIYIK